MNTIYLDITELEAPYQKCTIKGNETKYFRLVESVYYTGTQECTAKMFQCPLTKQLVQNDANADVHYGTIKSLAYFQNELDCWELVLMAVMFQFIQGFTLKMNFTMHFGMTKG